MPWVRPNAAFWQCLYTYSQKQPLDICENGQGRGLRKWAEPHHEVEGHTIPTPYVLFV